MKDLVLLGPNINAEALDTFKVVCTPERIATSRQSARCTGVRDDPETRKAVAGLASYWKIDAAFVDPAARLSDFRLLAMDMDSTLIDIESLDEVAACAARDRRSPRSPRPRCAERSPTTRRACAAGWRCSRGRMPPSCSGCSTKSCASTLARRT